MRTRPYKTWIEVSKAALIANARALKATVGDNVELMAVVKANAYGHGITEVSTALAKAPVDWFGVDSLREADAVAKTKRPVLIMGYTPQADVARAVKAGHSLIAYDVATIRAAAKAATKKRPARIHLKLETGTSRQGVHESDLAKIASEAKKHPNVIIEGLSTHYANIEDTTDSSYAMAQLAAFTRMYGKLRALGVFKKEPIAHTAASAATILYPETHFGMARIGIALYGLWPSKETRVSAANKGRGVALKPALTWKTIVAQVKNLPEGTPVSYGLTEKVSRDSRVAVIPVGYWDGYDRKLSGVGRVLIKGKRAKVLGRVCMNMFVVDVTDIPGVRGEDEVVILGSQGKENVSAEEFASWIGTINYEAVTRINPNIPRILV